MTPFVQHGITLPNGCVIVHGRGIKTSTPFQDIPVTLNELSAGTERDQRPAFRGQAGYIEFNTQVRLPRHVHFSTETGSDGKPTLLHERIFVSAGVALVELGGQIHVIPPKTLVTIAPGVPHTWTACPAGVDISPIGQDGESLVSNGTFLMLYEYEDITGFFPTAQTDTIRSFDDYARCGDLDSIRIPHLSAEQVFERCWFVYGTTVEQKKVTSGP